MSGARCTTSLCLTALGSRSSMHISACARLYQDYYSRRIPKEQAQREKKQCCRAYREAHHREQQRLETMRAQLEAVKASGCVLTQIIQTADTADLSNLLLSSVKCLCLLRSEMVSYELIEQKINERRQSDAKNTKEQTAHGGGIAGVLPGSEKGT